MDGFIVKKKPVKVFTNLWNNKRLKIKHLWLQYVTNNKLKIWLIHLFLRSSHICAYLKRQVKIKKTVFTEKVFESDVT